MTNVEKTICNYMASFFEDHFDKITYDLSDSDMPTDKIKFIQLLRKNVQAAMWAYSELADWGMDKTYLQELCVYVDENNDFRVMKIHNDYIRIEWDPDTATYKIQPATPKTKTITYFE